MVDIMSKKLNLGVLDFCCVPPKKNEIYALSATIELARRVDELGYSRYWLAEHHGSTAHASPELLIPVITGLTRRIRVGTAGVLLSFYSPFKVAENFKLLEALFSERIDLGIARGLTDKLTSEALLDGRTREPDLDLYKEKVETLIKFLRGNSQVWVMPFTTPPPEVWVLGSGRGSMPLAAQNGVGYSHSLLHDGFDGNPSILEEYCQTFQLQSQKIPAPLYNIAVAGICAETETSVKQLLEQHTNNSLVPSVVGTPNQCKEKLLELQERYKVNEIIFLDLCQEFEARLRSYQLLAAELGLSDLPAQNFDMSEYPAVA